MASFQVTCHTPDEMNAERRHDFWISLGQERVELAVGRHGVGGRTYLTTAAGDFPPRQLLGLPVCSIGEGAERASDKSRWAPIR